MTADDHAPGPVLALVELIYRADWTSLNLALEVREFEDYAARSRMLAPRPPWLPESSRHWPHPGHRPPPDVRPEPDPDDEDPDEDDGADEPDQRQHLREYRLLIAPGGRFRADDSDGQFAGSDGQPGQPGQPRYEVLPPGIGLLRPGWLPARFELELAGPALAAGRQAHRLIGRPRPVGTGRQSRTSQYHVGPPPRQVTGVNLSGIDRIDVALDAELGILLRCELMHRGQLVSRSEITALAAGPADAAEAGLFSRPPAGDEENPGPLFTGPGWERAKSAANAGATALAFMVRHSPHREPPAGAQAGATRLPGHRPGRRLAGAAGASRASQRFYRPVALRGWAAARRIRGRTTHVVGRDDECGRVQSGRRADHAAGRDQARRDDDRARHDLAGPRRYQRRAAG